MGPRDAVMTTSFRHPQREQINMKHPLAGLAELIKQHYFPRRDFGLPDIRFMSYEY
ncbi:hypothetical protein SAMN02787142_2517 [Burkholderia sp. WP9]|nr:hypothetical protein SAMN02787142_2517 [Burkholderia sp. WP9]